jgi:hypothetical protein
LVVLLAGAAWILAEVLDRMGGHIPVVVLGEAAGLRGTGGLFMWVGQQRVDGDCHRLWVLWLGNAAKMMAFYQIGSGIASTDDTWQASPEMIEEA